MSKKNIAIIFAAIAVIGGLFWWGKENQIKTNSKDLGIKSQLEASETFYDFGTISMANGKVYKKFKLTNGTDKDINVESITTSCMCTNAYVIDGDKKKGPFGMEGMGYVPKADYLIKAGGTGEIEVEFDPNAHGPAGVGPIDRIVTARDENGGTIKFEIKANVTP
jgi:hypothetical protein